MSDTTTPRRRTKIVATLGPATDDYAILEKTLRAGVDVVRLNFSHGDITDQQHRVQMVRDIAKKIGHEVGILADLQGPKIRIARFKQGKVYLNAQATFILDASLAKDAGDEQQVGIDYAHLPKDVNAGNTLLLNDGRIVLQVTQVVDDKIHCIVIEGGELSNNKGINLAGGGLSAPALTDKDKHDLNIATALQVDYIAISFVRNAADIEQARALLKQAGSQAGIISKIERVEAIAHLDDIIRVSDAVMVARGDLGVEVGDPQLPGLQKRIIARARALNKAVITATQMMESMIENSIPTRAEVFDVANAVLDGTDAVMLSAETASGKNPDKVVAAMASICLGAEQEKNNGLYANHVDGLVENTGEAIAKATMYTANHLKVKGIIALTESGSTPLWMSRIRSGIPIYGLCEHADVRRRMMLYRGVYPLMFDPTQCDKSAIYSRAVATLSTHQLVHHGDVVVMTCGDLMGVVGGTNTMKILKVGEVA